MFQSEKNAAVIFEKSLFNIIIFSLLSIWFIPTRPIYVVYRSRLNRVLAMQAASFLRNRQHDIIISKKGKKIISLLLSFHYFFRFWIILYFGVCGMRHFFHIVSPPGMFDL